MNAPQSSEDLPPIEMRTEQAWEHGIKRELNIIIGVVASMVVLGIIWGLRDGWRWDQQMQHNADVVKTMEQGSQVRAKLIEQLIKLERDQAHTYERMKLVEDRLNDTISTQLRMTPPEPQPVLVPLELSARKRDGSRP